MGAKSPHKPAEGLGLEQGPLLPNPLPHSCPYPASICPSGLLSATGLMSLRDPGSCLYCTIPRRKDLTQELL